MLKRNLIISLILLNICDKINESEWKQVRILHGPAAVMREKLLSTRSRNSGTSHWETEKVKRVRKVEILSDKMSLLIPRVPVVGKK